MRGTAGRVLLLGLTLVLGVAIGTGAERWRVRERMRAVTTAEVFENVLSAIRTRYVDSLTEEELYAKAAKGVVSTLGDPYSAFMGPAEYGRYRDLLAGRGRSTGLRLTSGLTGLRVAAVTPSSPADRVGFEPGDYLLSIDGADVATLSPAQAAGLLRDRPDSVRLRFRTPGDSVATEVTVRPEPVHLPAVSEPAWLTDSTVYLALGSVSTNASRELRDALGRFPSQRLKGLVLDLRGNPGGPLDEALAIADLFLAPGQRIGAVSKRRTRWATYFASAPDAYPSLALSILVDRRTASSAEIIAAALRDNGRAWLVGERTFGKGLIQTTIQMGDSAALRLTTGRWEGPGGRLIAGGIAPDSLVVIGGQEAMLRRVFAKRPAPLAQAYDRLIPDLDSTQRAGAVDSLVLGVPALDRLRTSLLSGGVTLSRRMAVRHRDLFDREFRRVAAAATGNGREATRQGLLGDPAVAAGLAWLGRQ